MWTHKPLLTGNTGKKKCIQNKMLLNIYNIASCIINLCIANNISYEHINSK